MPRRPKRPHRLIPELAKLLDLLLDALGVVLLGWEFADGETIRRVKGAGLVTDRELRDLSYLTLAYKIGKYEWDKLKRKRLAEAIPHLPRISPEEDKQVFQINAIRMLSSIQNHLAKLKTELGDKLQREALDLVVPPTPTMEFQRETEWVRFIDRIADGITNAVNRASRAEFLSAHQLGVATRMLEESRKIGIPADGVKVVVIVRPDACEDCKRIYLEDPNDITKRKTFLLVDLMNAGSNVGLPKTSWKATIPPLHPNCVCMLAQVFD